MYVIYFLRLILTSSHLIETSTTNGILEVSIDVFINLSISQNLTRKPSNLPNVRPNIDLALKAL